MKHFLWIVLLVGVCSAADPIDQAKTRYLDKPVVVKSAAFRVAVKDASGYKSKSVFDFIPDKYVGKKATVIAVQETEDSARRATTQKVNAMGEVINTRPPGADDFDIVVKFEDGLVAINKETLQAAAYDLLLPEDLAKLEDQNKANLEKTERLVGRDFYATALSSIYRSDVTLAEMQPANRMSPPFLEPLHVLAAKWNEQAHCAIVKLELPSKTQALALMAADGGTCYGSNLEPEIPKFFSPQDIYGVKNRTVAIGMKEMAVHWAIGYPERENDWGRGGKQLVYGDYLMVYIDTSGKVEDVQRFQR
ncbi:MAG TPA: hypothetical protein VFR84_01095 [Candidatus Angelobacter sp.]|nr:hypothetical protein [Candidatus Angelobacter sp.]